jgi:DNA-binding beta-propeller fold protein YncE
MKNLSRSARGMIAAASVVSALLAAVHAGSAFARPTKTDKTAQDSQLVWPLPPDPPRIRYLESFYGATDFRKKSTWRRALLGPETDPGISLRKPYGVATDSAGRMYVSDTSQGAVFVFDPRAREVRPFATTGRVRLSTPIGLALDEKERVFVADAELNEVFCFDGDGNVLLALGRDQGMKNPTGLAIDRKRHRLYVTDSHLHQILVYSTDGQFLARWGSRGPAQGQFNFPTNLALDTEGNVYVVDTGNFRIQVLDPEGKPLSVFGQAGDGPGSLQRPKGIAVDSEGHVYVVDAAFNNFQIFDRSGQLLLDVGAVGTGPGTFWMPAGIHIDGKDRIFVVDQLNHRVQVFQYLKH